MIKPEFLQDAIGMLDDDLILSAQKARQKARQTPRRRFAFFVAAACLTIMLLAIPLGILIANQTDTPKVPIVDATTSSPVTTQVPQTTARPSILDIPGATVLDENDDRFDEPGYSFFPSSKHPSEEERLEWVKNMKENNAIVIGYIQDYTTVLVEDGEDYYQISTMTIQVLENVSGIEEKTVTAVYACRYYNDYGNYKPAGTYRGSDSIWSRCDQFREALICTDAYIANQGKAAGFLLLKESKDQTILIGNTTYNLSDYADYVLDACLQWAYYGGLWLRTTGSFIAVYPHILEEVFNKSFTNTYPCPYEYPFSYPLEETPE